MTLSDVGEGESRRLRRCSVNPASRSTVNKSSFPEHNSKSFLSRCSKTRSFDNLPSACEMGSSLAPNRRSSDPSLNEKWQDHRRSLELSMAVGPDGGGGSQSQEEQHLNGADFELGGLQPQDSHPGPRQGASASPEDEEEAELSVAVGMAEGQMENILQEATKEEVSAEAPSEESDAHTRVTGSVDAEVEKEATEVETAGAQVNGAGVQGEALPTASPPETGVTAPAGFQSDHLFVQKVEELSHLVGELIQSSGEPGSCSDEDEFAQGLNKSDSCASEPSPHRTLTNGFADTSPEEPGGDEETRPLSEPKQQLSERASLMESSTETLTEEAGSRGPESAPAPPAYLQDGACTRSLASPEEKPAEAGDHGFTTTLNGGSKRPSVSAFQSVGDGLCNGEGSEGPQWAKGSGDRAPLSRQVSLASCNSLILHPRGSCSLHRWCRSVSRFAVSPEQPSRSHLDDDGLAVHTDAIQQRLRQIEAGHQMEVETLKKQMQELWSRLKYQQHSGSHRVNGDVGDELVGRRRRSPSQPQPRRPPKCASFSSQTCMTDSEYNMDPNCLSRCSTEFFSEASWEQVDKQAAEVKPRLALCSVQVRRADR